MLQRHPDRIDNGALRDFAEFRSFISVGGEPRRRTRPVGTAPTDTDDDKTPVESMESAQRKLRRSLAEDLLSRLIGRDDRFFEDVVLDVLVALGYGGSRRDAATRVGRSGDGGIDGVIQEDRLGLDIIYVQAKKWNPDRKVGPREIREFMGALQDRDAHKGVFITTSSFTADATDLAKRRRIVLIDGYGLAGLMIDGGVGVASVQTFVVHRLDEDYFAEDDDRDSDVGENGADVARGRAHPSD